MGIAKYLEDIQKLRDNWAHLAPEKINSKALSKDPERARIELEALIGRIGARTAQAVNDLDRILELLTDPEVSSAILIEDLRRNEQLISAKLSKATTQISFLQEQHDNVAQEKDMLKLDLMTQKKILAQREDSLKQAITRCDALLAETIQLKDRIRVLLGEEAQKKAFDNEMTSLGVRPKPKKG